MYTIQYLDQGRNGETVHHTEGGIQKIETLFRQGKGIVSVLTQDGRDITAQVHGSIVQPLANLNHDPD